MNREHLRALTGVRFIAALMIVLHHGHGEFGLVDRLFAGVPLYSGVSFFFVLSGFILTHACRETNTWPDAIRFWVGRIAKIWPAHIVALFVVVFFLNNSASGGTADDAAAMTSNILLLQSWIPDFRYVFSFNSVSWTLSVELFFYALFPMLVYRIERNWPIKLAGAIAVGGVICLVENELLAQGALGDQGHVPAWALIQFNPAARVFEFVLGMSTAVVWKRYGSDIANLKKWPVMEPPIIGMAVASIACFAVISPQPPGHGFIQAWMIQGAMFAAPFAAIIFALAAGTGPIAKLLATTPTVFLGRISFSLYAIHQVALRWYQADRSRLGAISNDIALAVYIVGSIALAAILWHVIEEPCQRMIKAVYSRTLGIAKATAPTS